MSVFRSPLPLRRRAAAVLLLLGAVPAFAQTAVAPPARQVPGVYHQRIGKLHVTALFDGTVALPRQQLLGIDDAGKDSALRRGFVIESGDGVQTAVNAYLVNDGERLILVDAGTAQCFGPGLGQVLGNLRAAGYRPEQVDAVLLTHAHPDHLCGLLDAQGGVAYPNASVWLAREDADYWLDPRGESRKGVRVLYRPLFAMARNAVAPYRAGGRLHLFATGDTLPGGVVAMPSHGHSPGHTSYRFDGGDGQHLLVWGDIVHYHAVQFARPQASYEPDANREQAIASRRLLLAELADSGDWLAGAHLPFPGLGHVRREGEGYAWVQGEFAPLPAPAE